METGVGAACNGVAVSSPFCHSRQVAVMVPEPRRATSPKEASYHEYVANTAGKAISMAGVRTLGLFTSVKSMMTTRDHLVGRFPGRLVITQADAPRDELVTRIRDSDDGILLGVDSLWTGLDLPGLGLLMIDRLPFSYPTPLMEELAERDGNAHFHRNVLPPAVIMFLQGVGRLIRSHQDRGIILVIDPRAHSSPSLRRRFLGALPRGVPCSTSWADFRRWIKEFSKP
jgi:ATP-dependent DNA helicase DinG